MSFALHDALTAHVVEGEQAGLLEFKVQLNRPEDAQAMNGLEGEAFWDWCEANDYRHILDEYIYRNLIFGLLSDMCHFLYEGLRCSEMGKLSVAYSNFRKPLQDNLFYLEWILADWTGFLALFRQGPEHIDPSKIDNIDVRKATRIELIGKAMDKTPMGRWIDPQWLYELRYEKASDVGLDRVFNHAVHLVTTFKHYKTAPENINFIFCDDEDREGLWQHLYLLLPIVLMHGLQVVRNLFAKIAPEFEVQDHLTDLWLMAGFLSWAEAVGADDQRDLAADTFRHVQADALLSCPECKATIDFGGANTRRFWNRGEIECGSCHAVLPLCDVPEWASEKE